MHLIDIRCNARWTPGEKSVQSQEAMGGDSAPSRLIQPRFCGIGRYSWGSKNMVITPSADFFHELDAKIYQIYFQSFPISDEHVLIYSNPAIHLSKEHFTDLHITTIYKSPKMQVK